MEQKQLSLAIQKLRKNAPVFCTLFFAHFNIQTTRRTNDELGFIVQHRLNQVFEYSNSEGKNSKQLSSYLEYRGETKVAPPSMGSKNALVSV